jgi:tetratricopeptide (TPR) repeat protein
MNHPTDQVDELVLLSQQAVACDDYEQASLFLKRALEIAPLRKDVRAELARVLAHDGGTVHSAAMEVDHAPETTWSRPRASVPAMANETRSALRPLPTMAPSTAMRGRVDSASMAYSREDATPTRPRVSVRTEGNVNLQLEEEPVSFSEPAVHTERYMEMPRTSLHRLLEDDEDEDQFLPPPPAAPKRRRRSKLVNQGPTLEDWIANFVEAGARTFKQMHPARVGYAVCYLVLAVFVTLACFKTHKLFGNQAGKHTTAKKLKLDVTSEASVSVPSLLSSVPVPPPSPTEAEILAQGQLFVSAKKYDEAIKVLEPAMNASANSVLQEKMRETTALAYDSKATQLLQKNVSRPAVDAYRKAVALQPAAAIYSVHLANALYYQARGLTGRAANESLLESVKVATEVTRTDPQFLSAYQVLAQVQQELGNKAAAKGALQRVLNLSVKGSTTNKRAAEQLAELNKGA